MALITALGCLAIVFSVLLISIAFGNRLLSIANFVVANPLDNILFSAGISLAVLQFLLAILGMATGISRIIVIVLFVAMALAAGRGWSALYRLGGESWQEASGLLTSRIARLLAACIGFFVAFEAIMSTAPLSGSDAMHYHFTAPLLRLGGRDQPIFWLTHSFLTGLAHELIEMGLALGSDRIALALIFLGGFLTAVALFQLARLWMPVDWALATMLVFLAAPMVFWQITTSGSPDIWMAFYVLLVVLALGQFSRDAGNRWLVLASIYAGAGGGIKYTGAIIAFVVVLYVLWLSRSIRWTALSALAAFVSGAMPQIRNFVWTGDPFFPFLTRWTSKVASNPYALKMLLLDTGAAGVSRNPLHMLWFPISMIVRGTHGGGLGHYFGPVVLAFLPLLIFCRWRTRTAALAGALWLSVFLANVLTSQMARFLLPVFPLALALVISGAAYAIPKMHWTLRFGCVATLVVFGLFSTAVDMFYAKDFMPVALGFTSKEVFLDRMAPDHQISTFVNEALSGREGKTIVFYRHLYYLRIPYINGDPATSWIVDPNRITDCQAVLKFAGEQGIRWVVKTGSYPPAVSAAFKECEQQGKLVPEMRTEVTNLVGASRLSSVQMTLPVVVLRIVD